jgi:lipoprotein-anchoring transpeptidase ErfK/SrfK
MDGYGGLHPFGSAPPLTGPYWSGWDIARGFDVALDSSNHVIGAWVLDAWGGLHTIGSPPPISNPASYYQGHSVWQKFHYTAQGAYVVAHFGIVSANPGVLPNWNGYFDWGTWDAIRDIILVNPTESTAMPQPVSPDATVQFNFATNPTGVAARPQCGVPVSGVQAGKVILVSRSCQQLSAYQDGILVANTLVTTGRPALPTLPGWTTVLSRNHPFLMVSPWPPGSPFYYYPSVVQYVVWFRSGGYGIHDAYWEPNSALGPGSEYSSYASHGCIHVPLSLAQFFYSWAVNGTPVGVF